MASLVMETDPRDAKLPTARSLRLRVILKKDGEWWVARCLEHDIAVQARDLDQLQYDLGRVLLSHVLFDIQNDRPPFHSIPHAPAELDQQWSSGLVVVLESPRFSTDTPLPRIQYDARIVS